MPNLALSYSLAKRSLRNSAILGAAWSRTSPCMANVTKLRQLRPILSARASMLGPFRSLSLLYLSCNLKALKWVFMAM